jgi:hypothetical protein
MVNLTSAGTWRAPVEELIPVGPHRVKVSPPPGMAPPRAARLLVAARVVPAKIEAGSVQVETPAISDHEVIVFE